MIPVNIPQKSVFKVTEVCELTGVKPYVLRYWESEFHELTPNTSSSGQKIYEYKDIETIFCIKKLLLTDKLTVDKARVELKIMRSITPETAKEDMAPPPVPPPAETEPVMELTPLQAGGLGPEDLQKLILAKQKLQQMLSKTDSLKKQYNWN